jgi:hypothetical protein
MLKEQVPIKMKTAKDKATLTMLYFVIMTELYPTRWG